MINKARIWLTSIISLVATVCVAFHAFGLMCSFTQELLWLLQYGCRMHL